MSSPVTPHFPKPAAAACGGILPLQRGLLVALTLVAALVATRDASVSGIVAPTRLASARSIAEDGAKTATAPVFRSRWVTPRSHTPVAHSAATCTLPGGDLFAVWYGGSREGATDVALYTARRPAGGRSWSAPVKVVDRALAESELERSVKKLGNAVVFADRSGVVWLVYVSVTVGGWSGSALNVKTSRDEGRTWSESRRLTLNPFLNVASLVRNKPILATDGRIGLPVYHEFALKFPQMLWLTPGPDGTVAEYRIRSLTHQTGLIQPTLVPLDNDRVLMMLRDRSDQRRMRTAYSEDNGWTWSDADISSLPNPDAAVDAVRLRDGRILLAYNDASSGRENLRLAISADAGRSWRPGPVIESGQGKEYSYPFLIEGADGLIHLTYTWERTRIKHVEFNVAWLNQDGGTREGIAQ